MSQERTERQTAIDMIDAEIAKTVQQMVEMHKAEIDRLNATIAGQAEAIREQTEKVQERDKYIESLTARQIAIAADLDNRDKEIERLEAKEARLIHEARGSSEYALKEAEENAELREEIERLREGFRKLRAVPNGRRNGKNAMIEEIANEYLKGAE